MEGKPRGGITQQRILALLLIVEPYVWLVVVVLAPRLLWDALSWSPVFGSIERIDFYNAVTHALLVIVPLFSVRIVHRRGLIEVAGLNVKWPYLLSSCVFLLPLFSLSLIRGSLDPVVFGPVCEEMFFRMYLFWLYARNEKFNRGGSLKVFLALVASDVAFTAVHFVPDTAGYYLLESFLEHPSLGAFDLGYSVCRLFSAGALFSAAYLLTGTVLSSVSVHSTWNAFATYGQGYELFGLIAFMVEFLTWVWIRKTCAMRSP